MNEILKSSIFERASDRPCIAQPATPLAMQEPHGIVIAGRLGHNHCTDLPAASPIRRVKMPMPFGLADRSLRLMFWLILFSKLEPPLGSGPINLRI